jgi:hypothetical protein
MDADHPKVPQTRTRADAPTCPEFAEPPEANPHSTVEMFSPSDDGSRIALVGAKFNFHNA